MCSSDLWSFRGYRVYPSPPTSPPHQPPCHTDVHGWCPTTGMCAVGTQLAPSTQTGPPLPISDHNPFPEPLGVAPQLTVGCDHSSPPALYSPLGGQPCSPDLWTLRRQERDALRRAHSSLLAPNFSTVSHTWSSVISSSSSRLSCPGAISYQGGGKRGKNHPWASAAQ